jgi:cytochrome b561
MPAWQAAASGASHTLLYLLLLATPISGWFFSSAAGVPTGPFGVAMLQLPDMVDKNGDLAVTLKFVHMAINYALGALICLHIAAALKHLLINQDGIMSRMLPGHKK